MATVAAPTAFISYAWESIEAKTWVNQFAARLRSDGVETMIDQWHLVPGDQIPAFMERSIAENDFVLIICTPRYKIKSELRSGGVGYEGDIMTAEVLASGNHRKFIPILRSSDWRSSAPRWLLGKCFVDLHGEPYSEAEYTALLAALHGSRELPPPLIEHKAKLGRPLDLMLDDPKVEG
jgi:hypothetical protein